MSSGLEPDSVAVGEVWQRSPSGFDVGYAGPLGLECLSGLGLGDSFLATQSPEVGGRGDGGVEEDVVDFAGYGAFEAAEDFLFRAVLAGAALKVGASAWVVADSDQRDSVQGGVGLAVAAAVEPVSAGSTG